MTDFPGNPALPVSISTFGRFGIGVQSRMVSGGNEFASSSWGTANLAMYVPIVLPFQYPVRNFFWANGATASGNIDMAVLSRSGTKIISTGATAQGTVSVLQFVATDYVLPPGLLYLAMSCSSATATIHFSNAGSAARRRMLGLLQQATAHPLPAAATFAAFTTPSGFPLMGITKQASPNF